MDFLMPIPMNAKATEYFLSGKKEELQARQLEKELSDPEVLKKDEEIWKAAEGFEEIFLMTMMKQMRQTVFDGDDSLDSSNASKTYRSMFDEQLTKTAASRRSFGLSKMIHDSLVGDMAIKKNMAVKNSS
jgi:Rod binding domain-containing protein